MPIPQTLTDAELNLLSSLTIDEDKINGIEGNMREQSASEEWRKERTYRFTASRFQSITKRQRNHDSFAAAIMHPKPFSSKYVAHGLKYEPVALQEYQKFMYNQRTPVSVTRSGFVISKTCPVLGASPDAKIVDKGCSVCFGLGEVKCPYKKFEKINDSEWRLKRQHEYYAQMQGQMGVTWSKWCDFIVYTSKGLYVERIPFDSDYWQNLKTELLNYYFTHFIQFAAEDYQKIVADLYWINLCWWFYLKIFPFVSPDGMGPLFPPNSFIGELKEWDLFAILIMIAFLGALGNTTVELHFSHGFGANLSGYIKLQETTTFYFKRQGKIVGYVLERTGKNLHTFTEPCTQFCLHTLPY